MAKVLITLEIDKIEFIKDLSQNVELPADLVVRGDYKIEDSQSETTFEYEDGRSQELEFKINLALKLKELTRKHKISQFNPAFIGIMDHGNFVKVSCICGNGV